MSWWRGLCVLIFFFFLFRTSDSVSFYVLGSICSSLLFFPLLLKLSWSIENKFNQVKNHSSGARAIEKKETRFSFTQYLKLVNQGSRYSTKAQDIQPRLKIFNQDQVSCNVFIASTKLAAYQRLKRSLSIQVDVGNGMDLPRKSNHWLAFSVSLITKLWLEICDCDGVAILATR